MASLTRSSIKVNYHGNESFGYFLEQEPYARELLDAFMNSRFSVVLDLLDRNSVRSFPIYMSSDFNAYITVVSLVTCWIFI